MDPSRQPTSPPQAPLLDDVQHAVVPVSRWSNLWLPVLSLFILATLVLGFVRHNLRQAYRDNLGYWDSRISTSAVERVSYGTLWLKERRTDTMAVARAPLTARALTAAAHKSHVLEARLGAESVLERITRDNGFVGGAVADTECQIVAQKSVPMEATAGVAEACQRAGRAGNFKLFMFGREPSQFWLYLAYPVFGGGETSPSGPVPRRQVGVAVMVVEPWKALLPFLTSESESQGATETLAVWRYGDETIVFSPRLAMQGAKSVFRRPLSDRTLESLAARNDNVEFGEFTDYRGAQVFGAARYSEVADASVIRKVERKGALSEFHRRSVLEWSAGALFVLLLGSMIAVQQRHTETRNLKEKLRQQQAMLDLKRHVEVSEKRFRELVESVEAIVWEADLASLRVTFVSKGVEKILGYSAHEWLQTPHFWPDHLHPEDRERAQAAGRAVQETGAPQAVEYRMIAADGRVVWFRDYIYAKPGREGKTAQLRGIMVDIKEIKVTEEALRESRQLLQTTLYSLRDAVFIMILERGEILECNPAATEMFGYHRQEMVGQGPLFLHVNAAALQEFQERLADAVAEKGYLEQFEFRMRRKDGSIFPSSHTVTPLRDGRGNQTGWVSVVQDISERKRAEEALRRAEQEYRAIFEGALEGIYRVSPEGRILAVNPALARMLGYESAEELASSISDWERQVWLDPQEQLTLRELLDKQDVVRGFECRHLRKDGQSIWVSFNTQKVRGFDGRTLYFDGFIEDITGRKRAEAVSHRYGLLSERSRDAFLLIRRDDGRILEANRAAEDLYGFSRDELLAQSIYDLRAEDTRKWIVEDMARADSTGTLFETVHQRKDGSTFPVEVSSRGATLEGTRTLISVIRDVTRRRQAEEQLRKLSRAVEQSPACVVITNPEGDIEYVNPKFSSLTGYTRAEALGKNPRILKSALTPAATYRELWQTVLSGGEWHGEFANKKKNGELYWEFASISPIKDGAGAITHILAVKEDITERKRAEAELAERLRFETLLADLSARFVNVPVEQLGSEIENAQRRVCECLGLDGSSVWQVSEEAPNVMRLTHTDRPSGEAPLFAQMDAQQYFPWSYQQIMTGKWIAVSSLAELPQEAARDRETYCQYGVKSVLTIGLSAGGGAPVGALAFSTMRAERTWPEVIVSRLQLVAQMFSNALARQRSDQAVRQSEERFRAIFQGAAEGIIVSNFSTRELMYANPAVCRMLGYTQVEMTHMRVGDLHRPEDMERVEERYMAQTHGETTSAFAIPCRRKDGTTIYADIEASRLEIDGKDCSVAFFTDITFRQQAEEAVRESEERFRALSTASLEGIMIHRQGVILDLNPAFARLFGYEQPQELIGKNGVESLMAPESRERLRQRMRRQETGPIEVRCIRKDGTRFLGETDSRPVKYLGREATIVSCRDISQLKQAQEERQRAFDQLRALAARLQQVREEERKSVAREIHDQLGQTLTAIKIDLVSLSREITDAAPHLSKRESSILGLVDEAIQSVRRISTELRPGVLDDLGLAAAVEWAGEEFEARTGTICRLHLPEDDVESDPETSTALFRIFQETLTNVARHADASEVEVRLVQEDGDLTLEVHDDGKGITEDKLLDRESLGILGMRERALLLGGELAIVGAPEKGTTVRVRIPATHRTAQGQESDLGV